MKKYLLIAALVLSPALAMAQKLSPNAEIMLSRNNTTGVAAPDIREVSAFVTYNDEASLDSMSDMGVKINSRFDGFVTATIPVAALREAASLQGIDYISMGSAVQLKMDEARKNTNINLLHNNTGNEFGRAFTGNGVILGVIDTGLEYMHSAFRKADGSTRIVRVWDQTTNSGTPPDGFSYGTEYTTLEQLRMAGTDSNSEYHGSHTTGIAAAGDRGTPYYGVAPLTEIVFVGFKEENVNIGDAINYIFNYADQVGKPCVINMSLGSHFGPHDGSSLLDRVIDSRTGAGRIIVGAVGNEAEANLHASKTLTDGDLVMKTMLTYANPTKPTKIHIVDIWGDPGTNFKVKAAVAETLKGRIAVESDAFDTSLAGQQTVIKVFTLEENGCDAYAFIRGEISPENGAPHVSVEFEVNQLGQGRMPAITVYGEAGQTINMWNAALNNLSSNGKSGWSNGTNYGSVGEIGGTAKSIITVGSFDSREKIFWIDGTYSNVAETGEFNLLHRSYFSSMGPTADGRTVPHVLAPGNPVIAAINKFGFGMDLSMYSASYNTFEGINYYYGVNMGTSMAAPVVAGTVALMLEANPDLTPEEAKKHLMDGAATDDYMGQLPNNEYGAGRLDAANSMRHLLGLASTPVLPDSDHSDRVWREGSTLYVYSPSAEGSVEIYNITGGAVSSTPLQQSLTSIDASGYPHGIYIVKTENSSTKITL